MNMDLNLLPSQAKFQAAKMKLMRRVKIFVWVLVSVWVFSLLFIFGFWFVVKTKLSMVDKRFSSVLSQYQQMSGDVVISQQIKYQAKLVGKVLSERFEYGDTINKMDNFFSSNIILDKSELKGKDKFEFGGKILNGKHLDEVENKIIEINKGELQNFTSAKLTSLAVDKSNVWSFSMEVGIK